MHDCRLLGQVLLLGAAGSSTAGFAAVWLAGALSWYLQGVVVRRPEVIFRVFSELTLKTAGL